MTERKWTPGHWAVEYKHGETHLIAGGDSIMCDMNYYPWVPDNDSDWHLIAAAPDLYEALEVAVGWITESKPEAVEAIQNAFDALAKARGES